MVELLAFVFRSPLLPQPQFSQWHDAFFKNVVAFLLIYLCKELFGNGLLQEVLKVLDGTDVLVIDVLLGIELNVGCHRVVNQFLMD